MTKFAVTKENTLGIYSWWWYCEPLQQCGFKSSKPVITVYCKLMDCLCRL